MTMEKRIETLRANIRALETSVKKDDRRLACDSAKFLGEVAALEASAAPTRRQLTQLERNSAAAGSFLRQHLRTLADRLDAAKASAFLRPIFEAPIILRTAYFRDRVISLLLACAESRARRTNSHARAALLVALAKKWDACDKGNLWKSKSSVEALHLLRKAYISPYLADAARLGKSQTLALRGQLFAPLSEAYAASDVTEATAFSRAMERASRFRAKRLKLRSQIGGVTEEADANNKTDIMAWTIVQHLFDWFPADGECWKDLLPKYGYSGDGRNFQSLLKKCLHPFKETGVWRGGGKNCVRKRGKNIH
jgi:hypothetical protein